MLISETTISLGQSGGSLLINCHCSLCCIPSFPLGGRPSRSGTNQKWRSPDESVRSNLIQYGLCAKYVDVLVADAARTVWREGELFDAIVTDREGGRGGREEGGGGGEGGGEGYPRI